jgi:hypothetical protein
MDGYHFEECSRQMSFFKVYFSSLTRSKNPAYPDQDDRATIRHRRATLWLISIVFGAGLSSVKMVTWSSMKVLTFENSGRTIQSCATCFYEMRLRLTVFSSMLYCLRFKTLGGGALASRKNFETLFKAANCFPVGSVLHLGVQVWTSGSSN